MWFLWFYTDSNSSCLVRNLQYIKLDSNNRSPLAHWDSRFRRNSRHWQCVVHSEAFPPESVWWSSPSCLSFLLHSVVPQACLLSHPRDYNYNTRKLKYLNTCISLNSIKLVVIVCCLSSQFIKYNWKNNIFLQFTLYK